MRSRVSRVCLQRNSKQTSRLRCDVPCGPACDSLVSVLLSPVPCTSPGGFTSGPLFTGRGFQEGAWFSHRHGQLTRASSVTAVPSSAGMNAAVRAVVRMGIYVGAKVYFVYEVSVMSLPTFSVGLVPARGCRPQARGDRHTGYQQGSPGTRRASWGCWGHTPWSGCPSVRFVVGSRAPNK